MNAEAPVDGTSKTATHPLRFQHSDSALPLRKGSINHDVGMGKTVKAMKGGSLDMPDSNSADIDVIDAVAAARLLEPKQRQLVLAGLATRLWFEPCPFRGPTYSEFEDVLRKYLLPQDDLEQRISGYLGGHQVSVNIE